MNRDHPLVGVRSQYPSVSRDHPLVGHKPPIPSLLQEPIFLPLRPPQDKQGSLEPQQCDPGGRCLATMGSGPGVGRVLAACPLWRHYAIPGPLVRIEAMPRGRWARSCHLVRWFVLGTTDLCQEDQGPNRNPWPALSRHTHGGCGSSQRLPCLRSPGCWAASQRPPPWLFKVPHLPVDMRPASRGPPGSLPSPLPTGGGSAHRPSLPWSLRGGYNWRNTRKHYTPLWASFIFSPFTLEL